MDCFDHDILDPPIRDRRKTPALTITVHDASVMVYIIVDNFLCTMAVATVKAYLFIVKKVDNQTFPLI